MLSLTKEELKKKICEYETILTGSASMIPDSDKAQTRCGVMRIDKPLFKNDEDQVELTDKMAVVFGKDCQLKSILDTAAANATIDKDQKQLLQQFHMLIKASIPSKTSFVLSDGANMDVVSTSVISKEEIASLLKQCPKAWMQNQAIVFIELKWY